MATITRPNSYSAGTTIQSSQVNSDFNTIYNDYNGNVSNANIASGAAIAASKLNLGTIAQTMAMSSVADNWAQGADIASSGTTNIGAATGNYIHVTGTTTITAFDTVQAGTWRAIEFTGILTLTYSATALILPTSANITTTAGDTAIFVSEGSGNWRCLAYQKRDGTALSSSTASGTPIQHKYTQDGTVVSGTTTIPLDNDVPTTGTDGTHYTQLDTAITPNSSTNRLVIEVWVNTAHSVGQQCIIALMQDSTANAIQVANVNGSTSTTGWQAYLRHEMAAGTTSSTTFKIYYGPTASGTMYVNGDTSGNPLFGGIYYSSMRITEIKV